MAYVDNPRLEICPGGPRFSPSKVFIRSRGVEAKWKELNGLVAESIVVEETSRIFIPEAPPRAGKFVLTFTGTIPDEVVATLKKMARITALPKCTNLVCTYVKPLIRLMI